MVCTRYSIGGGRLCRGVSDVLQSRYQLVVSARQPPEGLNGGVLRLCKFVC